MYRMSRGYTSSWESIGDSAEPDIIYYNASIINNTTDDVGIDGGAILDPPIRFNETRDTAIVKDASKYQFSIIRFVVNGGNKDLPLFIPAIQSGTGQTNTNLTEYGVALSWNGIVGTATVPLIITPPTTYVLYESETHNPILAPIPRPPCAPTFSGVWMIGATYRKGDIVTDVVNSSLFWVALLPSTGIPLSTTTYWQPTSPELGRAQDLSTRYYWVYTYSHWVDLVNATFVRANQSVYAAYVAATVAIPGAAVYSSYPVWAAAFPPPLMTYADNYFTIQFPLCYLPVAEQQRYSVPDGSPVLNLWFNTNMTGLFDGFNNNYWNVPLIVFPWTYPTGITIANVPGYANNILCQTTGGGANVFQQQLPFSSPNTNPLYVVMSQDYASTSTLWSPIESIVFTSTLLPIQNEQTAPPNKYGIGNVGNTSATAQSAFQPIITDVALDLSSDPSGYRKMIYYAPTAEYRMADFQNSKQDIRNIDVQVYWKNRLDNNLYPLTMFNLSSVSIKLMFRKKIIRNGKFQQ